MGLQERNEKLFFRVLCENLERLMGIIYSPTASLACAQHGLIFRRPRGLFITIDDRGRVLELLKNWPEKRVKLIAVSDGQNVLGLEPGDMGIQGMGNLVGKLSLYTACAGVHPCDTLPVMLDVGTDNEALLNDKFYLGLRRRRVDEAQYLELVDEFMDAVRKRFGSRVMVQWENLEEARGMKVVERYRPSWCTFNDDQQGLAAAALAGIFAATTKVGAHSPTRSHAHSPTHSLTHSLTHATTKDTSNVGGNFKPLARHTFMFCGEWGLNTHIPNMVRAELSSPAGHEGSRTDARDGDNGRAGIPFRGPGDERDRARDEAAAARGAEAHVALQREGPRRARARGVAAGQGVAVRARLSAHFDARGGDPEAQAEVRCARDVLPPPTRAVPRPLTAASPWRSALRFNRPAASSSAPPTSRCSSRRRSSARWPSSTSGRSSSRRRTPPASARRRWRAPTT